MRGDEPPIPEANRWRARPLASFAIQAATVLVPTLAGVAAVAAIPLPPAPWAVIWLSAVIVVSTVVAASVERVARRWLPLAVLLKLSLVFPDRAPHRYRMARDAGRLRVLEDRIRDARERGVSDEPAKAAQEILSLVAALSAHDRKTRGHSERVRAFTDVVAIEMGLSEDDRDRLRWAALLHDVGKLRVPSRILNKAGRPDDREWQLLQGHPEAGERIVAPLLPWLGEWGKTIVQHHERYDGTGYPHGLAGENISLGARIVAVADSFEVMTASRAYKKPMTVPAARAELLACAGAQFDPGVVRSLYSVSIGHLWWIAGPTSWIGATPFLGAAQRAVGQVAVAAQAAAVIVVIGVTSALAPAASAHPAGGGDQDALATADPIAGPSIVRTPSGHVPEHPVARVGPGSDLSSSRSEGSEILGVAGGALDAAVGTKETVDRVTRQLTSVASDVGDAAADAASRTSALASNTVDETTNETDIVASADGTVDEIAGGQLT